MKTRAAVLTAPHAPFEIMELDIDDPGPGEVMLRMSAAGLCHSDLHMMDGDLSVRYPMVGGHEAAGIVEKVGPGVKKVAVGDNVVCSFTPSCGICRYCSTGRQNLCDAGSTILEGSMPDGTFRLHKDGTDYSAFCMLGAFSEFATVSEYSFVKVDDWLPLDSAVLVGCGVRQVQANQLVECPVQMDVLHVRRLLGGQRQTSQMPFQFSELRQIRQRLRSGMRAQVTREPIPVLSDARSRRRMLANERGRGVCHELGTDKPHGGWEPLD